MSSNKKLFSRGWVLGISLGLVCSTGAVFAGSIADSYATGDTLTATKMTAIKTAVNDNDTRVTAIGAGTQTCLTGMTRVGPTCVDTVRQGANSTWSAATDTCRAANKRLLTPGEYLAARNQNAAGFGMDTNGEFEWVDSVSHDGSVGGNAGKLTGGYMGPSTTLAGEILFAANVLYDAGAASIYFRCAR